MGLKVKPRLVIRLLISWFWQSGSSFLGKMIDELCSISTKDPLFRVLRLFND
jgi:hypothetical protein